MYLLILTLFLHPSPPSQWLVRAPLVIMLPQLMQGFPLPYGCNNKRCRDNIFKSFNSEAKSNITRSLKQSLAHLFFGTVATDHPGGQFHGVVLVLIMASITGVSPATAGKPEGRQWHKAFTILVLLRASMSDT